MAPQRSAHKVCSSKEDAVLYDSDAEPKDAAEDDQLSWRLDPSESLSDWTIEITSQQTTGSAAGKNKKQKTVLDVYHVHKAILAVGPHKSEYFSRLFKNGNFAEAQNQTSRIELHEIAAKAFPKLLDYVYSQGADLNIDTKSAVALHHLGQYFEIRRLRWEIKQFWQSDLSVDTCGTYYEHASIFQDEKILKAVVGECAENVMSMGASASTVKIAEPGFWLKILKQATISEEFSLHMSKLIANVCSSNKEIGANLFHQLTDAKYLPSIHFDVACQFIELEEDIAWTSNTSKLSSLQTRCIKTLSDNWEDVNISAQPTISFLRSRKPLLLAELYSRSLSKAKQELWREKKQLEDRLKVEQRKARAVPSRIKIELAGHHRRAEEFNPEEQSMNRQRRVMQAWTQR